jgi:uncharacterized protein YbjQ (UPF0145 family)
LSQIHLKLESKPFQVGFCLLLSRILGPRPADNEGHKKQPARSTQNKKGQCQQFGDVSQMKVTTLENIAGHSVEETLGVVRGSSIWTRRVSKNSTAGHRALEHMSVDEIADGLATVREKAEAKMIANAKVMGANAVIAFKVELVEVGNDMFQAIAFGTAVVVEALPTATPTFAAPVFANTFGHVANDYEAVVLPFGQRRAAGGTRTH